jgi:hypothetical protein
LEGEWRRFSKGAPETCESTAAAWSRTLRAFSIYVFGLMIGRPPDHQFQAANPEFNIDFEVDNVRIRRVIQQFIEPEYASVASKDAEDPK